MKFDTITTTTTTVTKAGSSSSSHAPGTVIISNPGNGHVQTQAMPSSHSNIQVINTKPVIIDGTMPVHISKKDKMVKRFTPAGKRRLVNVPRQPLRDLPRIQLHNQDRHDLHPCTHPPSSRTVNIEDRPS
ncbi:hypothetical protein EXIGLDRAFT_839942 [Exidia glandulosa HHB12029]|uniref:Uncharacterized protein n=1 Tax=Exidia glandulosa HHB12029 TaxID=1314781 RepID=A0A165EQ87_EXIGL|nr:hypothetical protein EXIGLDRAFT_839942 [Exidia glandulosa HHB12029]